MNNTKNVLVFPCGSEIGLEIYKSLNNSTHFTIFGGSSIQDHGEFVYENYIDGLPFVDDDDFVARINEVVKEFNIDFIFPAHDSVVVRLADEQAAGNIHCTIITSPSETCRITRSKKETYLKLENVIATPEIYTPEKLKLNQFPVFLKPEVGQGSKGTYLAKSYEEIILQLNKDQSLLTLEYLPGKEYTIDCFTNNNGKLLYAEGRERRRIMNGISVNSAPVSDTRFGQIAAKINNEMIFRGVWFFQLKENITGDLVLMEIAPRVAGTMGLARNRGVNLPLLSLYDRIGVNVQIMQNTYELEIDRALENRYKHSLSYEHVYIDFDDLVVFRNKVNITVIAFVFQCLNDGIKIHLITRHKQNIHQTLKKYRLEEVFDDIIWLQDQDDNKHRYITEKKAIFIDDSFTERKKVFNECGIAVFDSHMLESLLRRA